MEAKYLCALRMSDARLVLQLPFASAIHPQAIDVIQGSTQGIKQHPVRLDNTLDDQPAVGRRGPDGAKIIRREDIDLRQPTRAARAEIPE